MVLHQIANLGPSGHAGSIPAQGVSHYNKDYICFFPFLFMLNKRGQVTIFIIAALVLVGIVGIYLSLTGNLDLGGPIDPKVEEIHNFVEECIKETAKEALYDIGQKGGYFIPSELSTETNIPYYYIDNTNNIPSKERIGSEISRYINENLFFCTSEFDDFPEFNITEGEVSARTEIGENRIILDIEYPLTILESESSSILKDWKNIEIQTRLGTIYGVLEKIVQNQQGGEICLSCISDIATENELSIDAIDLNQDTIIFIVSDEKIGLNEELYEFMFATKYSKEI